MELQDLIVNILQNGIKPKYIFPVIQVIIAAYVILQIRTLLVREIAYRKFKGNMNISVGTKIRLYNEAGFDDGRIIAVNRCVIKIISDKLTILIPTKTFPNRDWVIINGNKPIVYVANKNKDSDSDKYHKNDVSPYHGFLFFYTL